MARRGDVGDTQGNPKSIILLDREILLPILITTRIRSLIALSTFSIN